MDSDLVEYQRSHLKQLKDETELEATVIKILVKIIDAYLDLFTNNVIHRDLKPSNLLVKEEKDDIVVKISDFGISHH